MLGTAVRTELQGLGHEITATELKGEGEDVQSLDIRDWEMVRRQLRECQPDIVFHLRQKRMSIAVRLSRTTPLLPMQWEGKMWLYINLP